MRIKAMSTPCENDLYFIGKTVVQILAAIDKIDSYDILVSSGVKFDNYRLRDLMNIGSEPVVNIFYDASEKLNIDYWRADSNFKLFTVDSRYQIEKKLVLIDENDEDACLRFLFYADNYDWDEVVPNPEKIKEILHKFYVENPEKINLLTNRYMDCSFEDKFNSTWRSDGQ